MTFSLTENQFFPEDLFLYNSSQVAAAHPPLLVQRLEGLVRLALVSHHDAAAPEADLADSVVVGRLVDLCLEAIV